MNPQEPRQESEQAGAQIGRYKLLEQIGEGGMGTIWMAEQREPVKRRVALKIIKLGMDTKQVIARFEAERQALALMDHPHIAKVLDAGATETGRPYFVMEYIKGIPILEYCDTEKLDTRARLQLFTSVCQAIQHAHQKGIIHRDIKPSNVLVTLHDGVPVPKVIDFGIAKATNSELTTKTLFTEHRQMIGTPAYMSPEQAEMSGIDIDTRSDVYSLGVLLYEMLTGTTPFDTQSLLEGGFAELMRAIREDDPHKPSTRISSLGDTGTRTAQQRRADVKKLSVLLRGDIDWIVMKCLEKDRTRRYETANGLAADIQRHLRDQPVVAAAPSASYKLRKFVRRNRLRVIAGSVVFAGVLVGIVATSWGLVQASRAHSVTLERELQDEQRTAADGARRARNAEALNTLLRQCEEALRAGDAPKARVALEAARQRAAEDSSGAESARIDWLGADLELATEFDAIDQFRWTWAGNHFGSPQVAAERTRKALARLGVDPQTASVDVVVARVSASAIRERILLALDRLLFGEHAETLRAVLRRVDPDPFRDALRDAIIARDPTVTEALVSAPAALQQPAEFATALGTADEIPIARRIELLQAAAVRRPSDIALLMALQGMYENEGLQKSPDRIRWLQAAIAADPRNSAAYTNLGIALRETADGEETITCYRMAIASGQENAVAYNDLGAALNAKGRVAEALEFCRKSVALDPTSTLSQSNLGETLVSLGKVDEGMACYRKAMELDPHDGYVHAAIGDVLRTRGQVDEAIASYRRAIELDPRTSKPYLFLGDLLMGKGRSEEALDCYRKCIALEPQKVWLHGKLGDAFKALGRLDDAIASFEKAIELDPNYNAYGSLGDVLRRKGRTKEAIANYQKSIELDPKNVLGYSILTKVLAQEGRAAEALVWARKSIEIAPQNATSQVTLGIALNANGKTDAACECFRKAIELDPQDAEAHHSLGAMRFNGGDAAGAVPSYRKAVELDPKNALYEFHLAATLQAVGEHAEALQCYLRTLDLEPKNALAMSNVGTELEAKKHIDEAITWYRKALDVDPDLADAHCNLGSALASQGRFTESLESYRRGHELGSKRPDWKYPSADWVRKAEKRIALEAQLPGLIEGTIPFADNAERLEAARMCQIKKLVQAAVRLYTEAFAADPRVAEDLDEWYRYNAAACAALSAAGGAQDAARLRKQALDWLRADLALHTERLKTGTPQERSDAKDALREWEDDADLAGIRDSASLASLPPEENDALGRLWDDVADLLRE